MPNFLVWLGFHTGELSEVVVHVALTAGKDVITADNFNAKVGLELQQDWQRHTLTAVDKVRECQL